jgi:protein-tyrosine phosphatase
MARPLVLTENRHLPLEGTYNVRDIGGYATADGQQTRWRTIYRADSLHRLSLAAQEFLLGYGLRTIIDLRLPGEVSAAPNVFATGGVVRYRHHSVLGDTQRGATSTISLAQMYRHILDNAQETIAAALAILAEPDALPAIVHCTAGKDRTGLVIALLLGLARVPDATIAADYALTARYLEGDFWHEARQRASASGYDWAQYQQFLACPPELMLETLGYIDERYGGIPGYLRQIGLSETQLTALRAALVVPAGNDE